MAPGTPSPAPPRSVRTLCIYFYYFSHFVCCHLCKYHLISDTEKLLPLYKYHIYIIYIYKNTLFSIFVWLRSESRGRRHGHVHISYSVSLGAFYGCVTIWIIIKKRLNGAAGPVLFGWFWGREAAALGRGVGGPGQETPRQQVRSSAPRPGCLGFGSVLGGFQPGQAALCSGRKGESGEEQPAVQINLFPISGRAVRVWYFTKQFLPLIGS